jgi:hypothetical protein
LIAHGNKWLLNKSAAVRARKITKDARQQKEVDVEKEVRSKEYQIVANILIDPESDDKPIGLVEADNDNDDIEEAKDVIRQAKLKLRTAKDNIVKENAQILANYVDKMKRIGAAKNSAPDSAEEDSEEDSDKNSEEDSDKYPNKDSDKDSNKDSDKDSNQDSYNDSDRDSDSEAGSVLASGALKPSDSDPNSRPDKHRSPEAGRPSVESVSASNAAAVSEAEPEPDTEPAQESSDSETEHTVSVTLEDLQSSYEAMQESYADKDKSPREAAKKFGDILGIQFDGYIPDQFSQKEFDLIPPATEGRTSIGITADQADNLSLRIKHTDSH